jgi:nucleoside-diphosphate-sugar epimerase
MKSAIIGGTGFIGTKCVSRLRQLGHEVIAASPGNHNLRYIHDTRKIVLTGKATYMDSRLVKTRWFLPEKPGWVL